MSYREHYGDEKGILLLSHNGILNAVNTNRNYGKTWAFKKRAFKRALKYGRKTIWIRMFKEEAKQAIDSFYKSADLQKYCGISLYDKETNPNGNLKQEGRTFYYRKNKKQPWRWFLKVFSLSQCGDIRSADDVKIDTIVFDEYTKPAQRYKRYHGNIVVDFLDIFYSIKREHKVICILLGNKESFNNPFFTYFGITPPPHNWEGIRRYRNGAFVLQQINNKASDQTEYESKTKDLLRGTSYGNYIFENEYKAATGMKPRKTPPSAALYVQLLIKSCPLKISVLAGNFYVNRRIDTSQPIYCDILPHRYRRELLLIKQHKKYFSAFIEALAINHVFYDDELTREATAPFISWLNV